ncbi:hypothetical protein KCU77_g81, partial [Aureobasidium melanogenum]
MLSRTPPSQAPALNLCSRSSRTLAFQNPDDSADNNTSKRSISPHVGSREPFSQKLTCRNLCAGRWSARQLTGELAVCKDRWTHLRVIITIRLLRTTLYQHHNHQTVRPSSQTSSQISNSAIDKDASLIQE